jgi:hypothetical protein
MFANLFLKEHGNLTELLLMAGSCACAGAPLCSAELAIEPNSQRQEQISVVTMQVDVRSAKSATDDACQNSTAVPLTPSQRLYPV